MHHRLYHRLLMLIVCGLYLLPVTPDAHVQCNTCHLEQMPTEQSAELKGALPMLCMECHMDRFGDSEHIINVIPTGSTGGLPLVEGKLGCTTCHDPHGSQAWQLRVSAQTLCMTCHQY